MAARNFGDTYIVKFLKRWMDNCDHPPHRLTTRRLAEASSLRKTLFRMGWTLSLTKLIFNLLMKMN